ncbi:MAG: mechanosensitive ion channel family protein [Bacteroidota bacterium]
MLQKDILILSALLVSGIILGWILRRWLFPVLIRIAGKTKQNADNLILNSFKKWIIVLIVALGAYIGINRIPLTPKYHDWIDKSFVIFYIICATLMLSEIVLGMLRFKTSETDSTLPSSSIISKIAKAIIYGLGLVLILQSMGISVAPILTAMGVGGLAVALALQDTLSNLFAGLQILAAGKVNQNDFIRLDNGQEGFVQDISWRNTTIKNAANQIIIVPNAKLSNMIATNILLEKKAFTVSIDISVDKQSDLKKVEGIAKEVVLQTLGEVKGGIMAEEPAVRFVRFGNNSIYLKASLQVEEHIQQAEATHIFIMKIHERFMKEGIQLATPIILPQTIQKV